MDILNMKPLVSVVTACYNGSKFMPQWVDSILSQIYPNVEIVFVNDGSTDNTGELFENAKQKFIEHGYSVKYIEKENAGAASAVNDALKIVEGDYLMLYDIDDILMPTNISEKADLLTHNSDIALVRNNGYFVNENNLEDTSSMIEIKGNEGETDLFQNFLNAKLRSYPGSYMVRLSVLFANIKDKEIYVSHYGQNFQIIAPVIYFGKAAFIDKPLMKYVIYKNSHSHSNLFSRRLELFKGYEGNLFSVVNMLDIPEDEKAMHLKTYKKRSDIGLFELGIEYNQKDIVDEQYKKIKLNDTLNPRIKRMYFVSKLPLGCFVLKNLPRVKRASKRLVHKIFNKKEYSN